MYLKTKAFVNNARVLRRMVPALVFALAAPLALAFDVVRLAVEGVVSSRAAAVAKSSPGCLRDLARAAARNVSMGWWR